MYRYKIGTISVDCGYEEFTIVHEKGFCRFEFDSIMSEAYAKAITDEGIDCFPSDVLYNVKKSYGNLGLKQKNIFKRLLYLIALFLQITMMNTMGLIIK